MKFDRNKILPFKEFFKLKRSIVYTFSTISNLIFFVNFFMLSSMISTTYFLIPLVGIISVVLFSIIFILSIFRLERSQDVVLLVEWISSVLMLIISCSPLMIYVFLNGNWEALSSVEYFLLYLTWSNITIPLVIFSLLVGLYGLLIMDLYRESYIYYNFVNYKR